MKRIGPARIRELLPQLDASAFSREIFELLGVFVIRGAIPSESVRGWRAIWDDFRATTLAGGRNVNRFNPVAFDDQLPDGLVNIYRDPSILDVVEKAFGPNLGLYANRFVVKDEQSRGPVFLHQDYPYHLGWPNKASAFVPLVEVTPESGGLVFYPGTHHFGYLGDAGEINPEILEPGWPSICPSLQPGDFVLMNSLTWHCSGPHVSGPDRVMADVIYQPASDPSSMELVRGQWDTEIFLNNKGTTRQNLFKRSRASRLVEMQRQLDQATAGAKAAT